MLEIFRTYWLWLRRVSRRLRAMTGTAENIYDSLWPARKESIHSILSLLGHDLSEWNKIKGGASKASVNPKFCYNWSFRNSNKAVAVCLWHAEIDYDDTSIFQQRNLRGDLGPVVI